MTERLRWQKKLDEIACNDSERALIRRWLRNGDSQYGSGHGARGALGLVEVPAEANSYSAIVAPVPEKDEAG